MTRLLKHDALRLAALAVVTAAMLPAPAPAQSPYPAKPVRIIVAYAAGGVADVMARLIATPLGADLGQPVIVENRAGAGGAIGTQACVAAAPDGYTLCMGSQSSVILNPMLSKEANYDAVKSFTPISLVAYAPNLLVVSPRLNVKTIDELIRWIRANPGAAWGTSGAGTSNHLMAVYLNREFGLKIEHAPYKGGILAVQDVLAGHIPMAMDQISSSIQHVRKGTLVAVAQSGATRSVHLPEVATFAETVVPKFRYDSFQALLGPAGLAPEVVQKLNGALRKALALPDVRERMIQLGGVPVSNSPEEFAAQIREQIPLFRELVQLSGLKPQ
ncbi:MAG: tripartite tricarboxylate transporter substrate binding protein [Burkholderiales bacterium]|nr:tripartite tricarboxylate transporter substrate binding protein [Burkholderiales bacterium]